MRIAFSSQPIYSHLVPVVLPAAAEAAAAGHDVVVLTSQALADEVRRAGLRPLVLANALGPAELAGDPDLARELGLDMQPLGDFGTRTLHISPEHFTRIFAGPLAGRFAAEAIEELREWKPDLVVGECTDYGSYYAAEYLGVPAAVLDIAPLGPFDAHPATLEQINTQRGALGLAAVSDPLHPFRRRRLGVIAESFYPPQARTGSTRYFRPPHAPADQQLDPEVAALPGDRPWVLATLGSNAARLLDDEKPGLLDTLVDVLGELPVTGIVALGRDTDPDRWRGARPDNVHLTSFAQQQLLLPLCDAFVTHAGFSGIRESLSSGVPVVAVPMFAEQPANAARVAELGAGRQLAVEDATHARLRQAIEAVLDDPVYRYRARDLQRELLSLPEFSALVGDLEELVS